MISILTSNIGLTVYKIDLLYKIGYFLLLIPSVFFLIVGLVKTFEALERTDEHKESTKVSTAFGGLAVTTFTFFALLVSTACVLCLLFYQTTSKEEHIFEYTINQENMLEYALGDTVKVAPLYANLTDKKYSKAKDKDSYFLGFTTYDYSYKTVVPVLVQTPDTREIMYRIQLTTSISPTAPKLYIKENTVYLEDSPLPYIRLEEKVEDQRILTYTGEERNMEETKGYSKIETSETTYYVFVIPATLPVKDGKPVIEVDVQEYIGEVIGISGRK